MIYITTYPLTQRINPMRKLLLTTAAVAAAIGLAGCGDNIGTFTDNRDGKTYKTVKIGRQTWMAENLNYNVDLSSGCYNNDTSYCNKYGRLYDWDAAMIACPAGWKLPDTADWRKLVTRMGDDYYTVDKIKSKSGWNWNKLENASGNGTDDFGFSALPGGYRHCGDYFESGGDNGFWWTATAYSWSNSGAHAVLIGDDVMLDYGTSKVDGISVRCVADRP